MAYINGILVWVSKEQVKYNVTSVQHPVETGINITDHIIHEPLELSISGKFPGPYSADDLAQVRKMHEEGELVMYEGRNRAENFQIIEFSTGHDYKDYLGCDFDMTLRQVRIANGPTGTIEAEYMHLVPINTAPEEEEEEGEEEEEDEKGEDGESKEDGPVNAKEETQAGLQQTDLQKVAGDILHFVKKGETAFQLAQKYKDVGAVVSEIAQQIPGGPEFIEIGETLVVASKKV